MSCKLIPFFRHYETSYGWEDKCHTVGLFTKDELNILKEMLVWDVKNNKPYDVFIKGITTTILNLEWFTYRKSDKSYYTTKHGLKQIENYIKLNG